MRYLILMLVAIWFIACALVGCADYRSKSKPVIPSEESFVEYTVKDFEEASLDETSLDETSLDDELENKPSVSRIKFVHIVL